MRNAFLGAVMIFIFLPGMLNAEGFDDILWQHLKMLKELKIVLTPIEYIRNNILDYVASEYIADQNYQTPLAGEPFKANIAGRKIEIPPRDRHNVTALNAGTSIFTPDIGDDNVVPFAALYLRRFWSDNRRRIRAILTGVVNYVDYADSTWNDGNWEFLLHWHNYTLPFPTSEVVTGRTIGESKIYRGRFVGGIGLGWKKSVYPHHFDNNVNFQVMYKPGYLYTKKSDDTAESFVLPPNTFIHQLEFSIRYDSFHRNLMELPHRGWAGGITLTLGRRNSWSDHGSSYIMFRRDDTRDYLRVSSYVVTALDVPYLSERHRILFYGSFLWSPSKNTDRYSAFRVGGGPSPSESFDMSRHPFPGALFDQYMVEKGIVLTFEYRLELFFFFYVHIRETVALANVYALNSDMNRIEIEKAIGNTFSIGITTGFFWNSVLYIEYAYDNRVNRQDDVGHGILISWSKEF